MASPEVSPGQRTVDEVAKKLGRAADAVQTKAKRLGLYREKCRGTFSASQAAEPPRVDAVATHFRRAPRNRVADLLDRLATRHLLVADDAGRYRATA